MAISNAFYGTYTVTATISTAPNLSGTLVVPDPNNSNNVLYTLTGGTGQSITPTFSGNNISFSIRAGSPVAVCPFTANSWNPASAGKKVWSGGCSNGTPGIAGTQGTWRATT